MIEKISIFSHCENMSLTFSLLFSKYHMFLRETEIKSLLERKLLVDDFSHSVWLYGTNLSEINCNTKGRSLQKHVAKAKSFY